MREHILVLLWLFLAIPCQARTITVKSDGSGDYPTIQVAIDTAVDGDTVIISPGTYTGKGNRDIDFKGKAITVRSINPNDPNIVSATIIDCNGTEANPHRGFKFDGAEDANSVLAGLTIVNGCGPRSPEYSHDEYSCGGAILCKDSSPTINHCIMRNNVVQTTMCFGGGICCVSSSPVMNNCVITSNSAKDMGRGGGIHCLDSSLIMNHCIITHNSAEGNAYGGGIHCYGGSLTLNSCTVTGNTSWDLGGGVDCASAAIDGCTIAHNSAGRSAGGICCAGDVRISNSVIADNSAGHKGGAIYYGSDDNLVIDGCTLVGNSAR